MATEAIANAMTDAGLSCNDVDGMLSYSSGDSTFAPFIAGDLGTAVAMAAADAAMDNRPEPVVLLSPACKSFDQFKDFAARGDAFRAEFNAMQQDGTSKEALS